MKMTHYQDIVGFFDFEVVYDHLLSTIPRGGVFLEGGAAWGKSSAYLCDHAVELGVIVKIVECWTQPELFGWDKDVAFAKFTENMAGREYHLIRDFSVEASKTIEDGSLDVMFIDMNHNYEFVRDDIAHWLPKVKSGGIIGGHDYSQSFPGVIQAVDEAFGNEVTVMNDICWIHNKE